MDTANCCFCEAPESNPGEFTPQGTEGARGHCSPAACKWNLMSERNRLRLALAEREKRIAVLESAIRAIARLNVEEAYEALNIADAAVDAIDALSPKEPTP